MLVFNSDNRCFVNRDEVFLADRFCSVEAKIMFTSEGVSSATRMLWRKKENQGKIFVSLMMIAIRIDKVLLWSQNLKIIYLT